MKAIYKRELKALFQNVVGWVFFAVFFAFFGIYLTLYNFMSGYSSVAYPLSGITFIFVIAAPILTMRVLSEERKNKTDQLILTAPITVGKIVWAKYLALATAYSIVMLVVCAIPPVLNIYGEVSMVQNYVAIFGFWVYGLVCIAIGLFASSLTEIPFVAAIIGGMLLLLGVMMGNLISAFSSDGIISTILSAYDLTDPLDEFFNGIFSIPDLIYYVSLIGLMLFLTMQSIEKRRWQVSAKKIGTSVFSTSAIVVAIAVCIAVNLLAAKIPEDYTEIDLTENQLFTLSDETKEFLTDFTGEATIYVVGTESDVSETLKKTLTGFEENSDTVTVTYVDTDSNPTFVSTYTDDSLSTGSMIVVCGDLYKIISVSDLYTYEIDYSTYTQTVTGYDGEGLIVSALTYVTSEDLPVIYELTGHDEVAMSGNFSDVYDKANVQVESLNLLSVDAVPEDCDLLVINGPQSDFSDDDVAKIEAYIEAGGSVFFAYDFLCTDSLDNVKALAADYDVTVVDGIVADLDANYYYTLPYYLLPYVNNSDYTSDISGSLSLFSPFTVGLTFDESNSDLGYVSLMTTSDSSFSKSGLTDSSDVSGTVNNLQSGTVEQEDGDVSGPFDVGMVVSTNAGGNLYFFGSTYMFTDSADTQVSGRNSTLFANLITQEFSDREDVTSSVVIPTKSLSSEYLTTTTAVIRGFGIGFIVVIPAVCIVLGIVIWAKRRRR